jgi:hypothetical protein
MSGRVAESDMTMSFDTEAFDRINEQVERDGTAKLLPPIEMAIWLLWDMNGFESDAYKAAAELAELRAKLERLEAVEAAARELTTTGFFWWSDGDDDRVTYRCLGCDVERDDVQSGTDSHHESCRVGKLFAALLDRKP